MGRSLLVMRGLLGIAAGIVAMAWPGITLVVLVGVFGLYAIVEGLTNLLHGLMRDDVVGESWTTGLQGAIGIIVGILVSLWPSITTMLLVTFIGVWAASKGILEIAEAIRLRHQVIGDWLVALNGLISVVFGLAVFAFPSAGAITIAWILGLYVAVSGGVLIMRGLGVRTSAVA